METVFLLEAERDYVRLHTPSRQYLVRGRLKDWAAKLPGDCFMQVHRSAIVRLAAVEAIQRAGSAWRARMSGGFEIPVSRSRGKQLRRRLGNG
jgi:DNA-binding LytR/AlgR family response regulator